MNTELQNKVWSILPDEFKEEVKEIYSNAVVHHPCGYNHKTDLLKYLFGNHNITSDAKVEDGLLTVPRSKVQEQYALNSNALREGNLTDMQTEIAVKVKDTLYYLFGSKCLPDETKQETKQETKSFQM